MVVMQVKKIYRFSQAIRYKNAFHRIHGTNLTAKTINAEKNLLRINNCNNKTQQNCN